MADRQIDVWVRIGADQEFHVGSVTCDPSGDPRDLLPGFLRDLADAFGHHLTADQEWREAAARVTASLNQEANGNAQSPEA